jgi:hypothetical protein
MRFAHKHYYVERYVKCDCCGVLIYDAGIKATAPDGSPRLFCSPWCRDWTALIDKGAEPRLPLPREGRAG